MPFVLDGIIILILVLCAITGIRRGFIKSVAHFVGALVSIFVASFLGGLLASWIFESFFRPGLYQRVLLATQDKTAPEAIAGLFESLPDFLTRLLELNGITASSLTVNASGAAAELATSITSALTPVFTAIIKFFAVIILFILLMIVVKAIAALLSGLFSLPILAQINSLLGGVFGVFFALVVLWLCLSLLSFLSPVLPAEGQVLVDSTVGKSFLTKFVVGLNPFAWLFT